MKQLITIVALAFAGTAFAQSPASAPVKDAAKPAPAASAPAKKEVKKVEKKSEAAPAASAPAKK